MRVKLTDQFLQNVKAPDGLRLDVWDSLLPGFGLRVGARKKMFVAMVRVGRQKQRVVIGQYPDLKLGDARKKAGVVMQAAQDGEDPHRVAHAADLAPESRDSVRQVVERFIDQHAKKKNRDWKKTEGIFNLDVLPEWGNRSIKAIKRRDVIELLDKAAARTSDVSANRVLAHVRKLFNWCLEKMVVEDNPTIGIKPPGKEQSRRRILSAAEVVAFWHACDKLGHPFGTIFKLLLVTAQRRDEVGSMRWRDIDRERGIWTVPREIAKNGEPNEVPLTALALALIDASPISDRKGKDAPALTTNGNGLALDAADATDPVLDPGGYVFPAQNGSGKPASGYSKAKERVDTAMAAKFAEDDLPAADDWWLHDLRRTAASRMAELGVAPHVIERVLNHVTGTQAGVAGIYNRYGYLPEKRIALELWAGYIGKALKQQGTTLLQFSTPNSTNSTNVA